MKRSDCYAARVINIIMGAFLMFLGVVLFFTGFSFLPIIGFFLAFIAIASSGVFLFAPRDSSCFLPR